MTTQMKWFGDKVKQAVSTSTNAAITDTAQSVLNESNTKVPFDTGELKNSGAIYSDQGSQSTSVSYSANHAVEVHETPRNYKNGKQHKYLESSINKHADQLVNSLKNEIGKALR